MPGANPMVAAAGHGATPPGATPMPGETPMPGAVPMAGVAPGAIPGGAAGPMGAGGAAQAPAAGTPEFAAYEFILAINKGEFEKLESVISSKATGQLKDLRNNSLLSGKKDELKQELATPTLTNQKNVASGKQFTLRSGQTIVSVTVKKEGEDYKVVEFNRTKARR